jgi:hypothetical protein
VGRKEVLSGSVEEQMGIVLFVLKVRRGPQHAMRRPSAAGAAAALCLVQLACKHRLELRWHAPEMIATRHRHTRCTSAIRSSLAVRLCCPISEALPGERLACAQAAFSRCLAVLLNSYFCCCTFSREHYTPAA